MRKLAYFAAVALLCTGIAVAQDQSQNPSSSPSAQQPSSSAPSGGAADQNQATPSSTDQNQANPSGQAGQAGQAGEAGQAGQAGQAGEAGQAGAAGGAHAGKKLPQTASPLPFLSLLGMGMMGVGGLRRYFKR